MHRGVVFDVVLKDGCSVFVIRRMMVCDLRCEFLTSSAIAVSSASKLSKTGLGGSSRSGTLSVSRPFPFCRGSIIRGSGVELGCRGDASRGVKLDNLILLVCGLPAKGFLDRAVLDGSGRDGPEMTLTSYQFRSPGHVYIGVPYRLLTSAAATADAEAVGWDWKTCSWMRGVCPLLDAAM